MSMVGTRHGVANIFRRAHSMPAPPNGRNGVMVSCYPRINAYRMRPRRCGVRHLPERSAVADSMKFIDSLVGKYRDVTRRIVSNGKESSSDLGVVGLSDPHHRRFLRNCARMAAEHAGYGSWKAGAISSNALPLCGNGLVFGKWRLSLLFSH
jgi:hypothetical protein